jgi:hypothetical protein
LKLIADQGQSAVPDLIVELDATDDDMMLRSLGFILRAIGDKRAVPALIRAIPKTLRKPASGFGLRADDAELLAFMQKNEHRQGGAPREGLYSFGRPVHEITGALEKLTGANQREEEIYNVLLGGGPRQQQLQRRLYHECAQRWATWWEANWKANVSDEKYAVVNLPTSDDQPLAVFPHGPDIKIPRPRILSIVESDADPKARERFAAGV